MTNNAEDFLQRRGERSGAPRFPLLRVPQQSRIWYNERSPRRAGMTGLDGTANTVLYEERKTYSRKEGTAPMVLAGQARPWEYVRERNPAGTRKDGWIGRPPSPGGRDHDNMCRKVKSFRHKKTWGRDPAGTDIERITDAMGFAYARQERLRKEAKNR